MPGRFPTRSRRSERLGCDAVVCAGDLVDYGAEAEETIRMVAERRIPCVRGNHDRWALRDGRDARGRALSPRALAFLASLTDGENRTVDGVRVAIRHARPKSDMDGILPDQISPEEGRRLLERAEADVLLVGHTHLPFTLRLLGGGLIANPGALLRDPAEPMGQGMLWDREAGRFVPGPAPGGGTFGVLELPSLRFTVYRADGAEVEIARATAGVHDRRR